MDDEETQGMLHDPNARRDNRVVSRLDLIGIATDAGASRRGSVMGPEALRVAELARRLTDLGFLVDDRGDFRAARGLTAKAEIDTLARQSSNAGYESLKSGARPIFLGGDHSISMGSVAGVARHCRDIGKPLFVLWLDAHGDFNTPITSETGNIHGMALAMLCGEPDFTTEPDWFTAVDPNNVAIIGARSLDRAEKELIVSRGVDVADMRTIDEFGVVAPLRAYLERVEKAGGHLHLSLDVDAMDPSIAPGVGTTVPGGLTFREAHLIMELIHDCGCLGSLDIVELNPFLDHAGKSAELLVDLTASLFGRQILTREQMALASTRASE
jgi:arginase